MIFSPAKLAGVLLITPQVFRDGRGFFLESYNQARFAAAGIPDAFVQDNHSRSVKGALRGLHFQREPAAQGKLVRAIRGDIFDVVVDIRPDSPTFGQWLSEILSAENMRMLYVPPGFAHGFLALRDDTEVLYKVTRPYAPEHDRGIIWNDPTLNIAWPDVGAPYVVSEKDRAHPRLRDALAA
ncbi:MAG: dTDP-4-dehydrorhamnose 3,5-epimerase [Candidatus Omnitrophica bacterium]|nr:dTDP-4-dehydrorhamnose 3,5-epimerase [Candidatus Omnitrophota bacterium]